MNRIERIFSERRAAGLKTLMPFVCGGRPSLADTSRMLPAIERAGASIVEVGVPFSDPIADGPVISAAMHEALESGVTVAGVFDAVRAARAETDTLGVVAMVSVSIAQRMGVKRFVSEAKASGFDGFIFPDAPLDEFEPLAGAVRDAGMIASLLVAPTTPPERAARIATACSGFVYLIARTGITGERDDTPDVGARVTELRETTDLPIACGFGVGTPEHVRAVVDHADAAIVGSALVRRIEHAIESGRDGVDEAATFVSELALGLS